MLQAEPELERCVGVDRLGDVEPEGGAFEEAEDGEVHAEADAEGVGDAGDGPAVRVDRADVVERGEPDVADAGDAVEGVPLDVADQGQADLGVADPEKAALPLGEVEPAEEVAAAEGVELSL